MVLTERNYTGAGGYWYLHQGKAMVAKLYFSMALATLASTAADGGKQSWACKLVATQLANHSLVTAAFDVRGTADCGGGFSSFDGAACFRAFCNASSWLDARAVCQTHGADLARIDTYVQGAFARCLVAPRDDATSRRA